MEWTPEHHAAVAAIRAAHSAMGAALLILPAGPDVPPPDPVPPTVSLLSPTDGASFEVGTVVALVAAATAETGHTITLVGFGVDGIEIGEDDTADPTSGAHDFPWTATGEGAHLLSAVAVDDRGLISTTAAVTVTVTPPPPPPVPDPTVTISFPAEGQVAPFNATQGVLLEAQVVIPPEHGAFQKVEWFKAGVLMHTEVDAPPHNWRLNTTAEGNVNPSTHTVTARLTTTTGTVVESAPRTFHIGAVPPPPDEEIPPPIDDSPAGTVFVAEPFPALIPAGTWVELRDGNHTFNQDVRIEGGLWGRGLGNTDGRTKIDVKGHGLFIDTTKATINIKGTKLSRGVWGEGPDVFDNGELCVVAPWGRGDMVARPYQGEPMPAPILGHLPEIVNRWRDIVITDSVGGGHIHISPPNHDPSLPRTVAGAPILLEDVRIEKLGVISPLTGPTSRLHSGKYPLHFHMAGGSSRGSKVTRVLVEQYRNHAFVPHASTGIVFEDCVAYDGDGEAYWWDPGGNPRDITYEHCLALVNRPAKPQDNFGGYRHGAYWLGAGTGLVMRRCHAVAVFGGIQAGTSMWPEHDHGVWVHEDNVAHNCQKAGAFTWQNDKLLHDVTRFHTWHYGTYGVEHGAYTNAYRYIDLKTVGGGGYAGIGLHASGDPAARDQEFLRHEHSGGGSPLMLLKSTPLILHGSVDKTVIRAANYGPGDVTRQAGEVTGTPEQRLVFA